MGGSREKIIKKAVQDIEIPTAPPPGNRGALGIALRDDLYKVTIVVKAKLRELGERELSIGEFISVVDQRQKLVTSTWDRQARSRGLQQGRSL